MARKCGWRWVVPELQVKDRETGSEDGGDSKRARACIRAAHRREYQWSRARSFFCRRGGRGYSQRASGGFRVRVGEGALRLRVAEFSVRLSHFRMFRAENGRRQQSGDKLACFANRQRADRNAAGHLGYGK